MRSNRKGIPKASGASLKKGECVAKENNMGIVIMKWRDMLDVLMLSTKHTVSMVSIDKRNRKNEEIIKSVGIIS